jgi:Response regulator containing CheY-like receiver and SARP domains
MIDIYVTMLGRFDILLNGDSILSYLGNSTKSISLLKYLMLNQDLPVSVSSIINIFWAEPDKSANPESALKTMISRIRSSLGKADPALKDCILAQTKSYQWNPAIPCRVDVREFEQLAGQLEREPALTPRVHDMYLKVVHLYAGDLAYSGTEEDWLVRHSLYLHHKYLKTVYNFIEKCKEVNDSESIIHICHIALEIDALDEGLNLELMYALKDSGQTSAALMQYRHITTVYQNYLGLDPSEKIIEFYKSLIEKTYSFETDLQAIISDLKQEDREGNNAFVCDYAIFKDIYQLQERNLERQKSKMFLVLASISASTYDLLEPIPLENAMRDLLSALKVCLRKGDTVSRYSPTQYAVLLPMMNQTNGDIVIARIKKKFYKMHANPTAHLRFQFGSL